MPSDDLIRAFMKDTKEQFHSLNKRVDRLLVLGLLILGAALGAHHGLAKVFEIATAFARGK